MSEKTARRVLITGHDTQGRSCLVSNAVISGDEIPGMGGAEIHQIWGGDTIPNYPDRGVKPAYTSFFPPLNGYRMIEMYMPGNGLAPSSAGEAAAAMEAALPGHAETLDNSRPGMHRSATLDMGILVAGRCVLQLDDGDVTLNTGDILIQNGVMHAWYNPFDEPCRLVGVMVGAKIADDR